MTESGKNEIRGPLSLAQRLKALAAFLPNAELMKRSAKDLDAWVAMCYDAGWVSTFDWPRWASTFEAKHLRDDPAKLEAATAEQLARLVTVLIRQDRFVDGALQDAVDSGLVTRILQRAAVLAATSASPETTTS